jgi:CRISPR/Cas system-associated exonuclease Cas4 (RecB family)
MITDNTLDKIIGEKLLAKQEIEKRPSSGKLSASKLYWPLQWQILASLGMKSEMDEYTLRKFQRGHDVEDWFMKQIETIDTQKFLEYRGVIGFCDSIVDTKDWEQKIGIVPLEVKSVTNMKFKRIEKTGADEGHILQNTFYAIAMDSPYHAITYIASDDYRILTTIHKTDDSRKEVDKIIDEYESALKLETIPKFEARVSWQSDIKYNNFPQFAGMTDDELKEAYKKLKK